MNRWLWRSIFAGIIAVTLVLAGIVVVAVSSPFTPRDGWFYQVQRSLEETLVSLRGSPTGEANLRIELAGRRLNNVERLSGTPDQNAAMAELEQALRKAVQAASSCPQSDAAKLRADLMALFEHVARVIPSDPSSTDEFRHWMAAATQLLQQPGLQLAELARLSAGSSDIVANPVSAAGLTQTPPAAAPTPVQVNPRMVYFHPGSSGAKHAFYPLVGKHGELQCINCHPAGEFAGTGKLCEDCHMEKKPASHFPGNCDLCHAPTAWADIHFKHAAPLSDDCAACHLSKRPASHYPGQCSACHTTSAWLPASFDHAVAQATDCATCHANKRPANHYNGQCSACHSTKAWKPATFNHSVAGATDCISCHSGRRPANHYNGQCSACHSTSAWKPATFNHAAAGATDCASCHSGNRPANHYDGQCSSCHSTSAWKPANFNHSFPTNHGGANGKCSSCHPSGTSAWTCFNCHNQGEMDKKHNEEGIPNYASRCLECHSDGRKHDN